ncbi:MAG: substrate-binding domain-containing protein, partial [Pseudomonadota bacterium]
MLKKLFSACAVLSTILFTTGAHAAALSVSGSTTVAGAILLPMQDEIESAAGVDLNIVANGSSRGMNDLANGRSQMAMISAPLDVTIAKIETKAPGSLAGMDLQGHQIGETRVSFVVHPSNSVTSMTLDDVAAVLSGQITNWSEL